MKKIIILLVAVLASVTVFAQRGIPRTDNVSVSSTIVRKSQTQRSIRKFDARIGYQQIVEVNYSGFQNVGADYIGGWRFNNWLFLGGGIGFRRELECADPNIKKHIGDNSFWSAYGDYTISGEALLKDLGLSGEDEIGAINSYAIPLYAHIRTYLSRTMATPYLSLSAGGRFASKDSGLYLDLSGGVDFRIDDRHHMFLSLGFWVSGYRDSYIGIFDPGFSYIDYNFDVTVTSYGPYEECEDNCTYSGIESGHEHIDFLNLFKDKSAYCGFSIKLGLSF